MKSSGVRNVDAARRLGLTQGAISRYRSGERRPAADDLAEMIELAGGSSDEVLGLKPSSVPVARLQRVRDAVDEALRDAGAEPAGRRR